jgi:hypothetical protein
VAAPAFSTALAILSDKAASRLFPFESDMMNYSLFSLIVA